MPLVPMFIVQHPLKPGILVPFFAFLLQSAQHFVAGVTVLHCIAHPGVHSPVGLKMSREDIPVVFKDAPRQNLLNSESFELLFSLLGKSRHFSM